MLGTETKTKEKVAVILTAPFSTFASHGTSGAFSVAEASICPLFSPELPRDLNSSSTIGYNKDLFLQHIRLFCLLFLSLDTLAMGLSSVSNLLGVFLIWYRFS